MAGAPLHILFLGSDNACRSQMAEAWLRHLSGGGVRASSAGVKPGALSRMAVLAMAEVGVPMDGQHAKGVDGLDLAGLTHVVTLCDEAERCCPAFPAGVARLHWPIPDPAELARHFPGLVNDGFRAIRDNTRDRVSLMLLQLGVAPPPLGREKWR